MDTMAVVLKEPKHIEVTRVDLTSFGEEDVVVDVIWSGISAGTERLLWSGRMPWFPGMGYPLVPGYESVGQVKEAGPRSGLRRGATVFVPGARCFGEVRGLFGGAAAHVVVPGRRAFPIDERWGEDGILLALAATAHHVTDGRKDGQPDLIVGHGVLGRLLARLALALGGEPPVVWETIAERFDSDGEYTVVHPDEDQNKAYRRIVDVSGDAGILDKLISRLAPGGEIVLAGFYDKSLNFAFPPAFLREARLRVSAQWQESDLAAVQNLVDVGALWLSGLITHRSSAAEAVPAYETAFNDPNCLKMVLDWRGFS